MHAFVRIASLGLLLSAPAAWADIVFLDGNTGNLDDQNVLFNGTGDIAGPGNLVRGHLNQSTTTHVDFTSTQTLSTPATGQARIAGSPTFDNINVFLTTPPGGTYTSLIFNIDAVANGDLAITVTEGNGTVNVGTSQGLFFDPLGQSGQNFYTVVAINGQDIRQVSISSTVGMSDISQIRIGLGPQGVVPEPSSVVLLGTMLVAAAFAGHRKYKACSSSINS